MFSFNPEMATENDIEDGDVAFDSYAREEQDETEYKEIDFNLLETEAQEVYIFVTYMVL